MKLPCPDCQHILDLDDSKLPQGGSFRLRCASCGKIILVSRDVRSPANEPSPGAPVEPIQLTETRTKISPEAYDGSRRALICESDRSTADRISQALKLEGFSVDFAASSADAFKQIESKSYDLVTLDLSFTDDKEGGQKILDRLNGQKPEQRRSIFVAIVSNRVKTVDAGSAFFHGGNITINKADLKNLEVLLSEGKRSYERLYRTYHQIYADTKDRL